jgi:long-chain acyl-CoA synthetase
MASELDRRMDAVMAALTGEGGPFALTQVEKHGRLLPVIAAAPPTLPAYFAHFIAQHADATFLVSGAERLTFAQAGAAAQAVGRALVGVHGVRPGDRIGLAMRNSPSWIVLYMGIVSAGGVATLLNGWWGPEELGQAVAEVGCTLVFADAPRVDRLNAAGGLSAKVVGIDDTLPLDQALGPVTAGADEGTSLPSISPEDPATVLFTSGSTGRSRGAVSSHRAITQATFNYLAQVVMMLTLATQDGNPPTSQPATLLNLPLFHVTAEVPVMLQSFAMGRKLVLMPKWDALEAMRLIDAEHVTYFVGVPLMSYEIATHPERARFDLSTVTDFAAGGAPRPAEHVRRLDAELKGAPLIGYGLTETNAAGTGNWRSNYLAKPDSAGRPSAPLIDLAIIGADGQPVPQGERGEIGIRSIVNFEAYWNDPGATAAAMTPDGYFLTGDIGYLDEDNYLFIVDRKKDIIIRGGENISCPEVEAALYTCDGVGEAAVFGLPDDRFGEVPGAVVHPLAGKTLDEAVLRAFVAEHVAAFKVPARIWVSAVPLPRLGTEKIDKVALRVQYRAIWAAERQASKA